MPESTVSPSQGLRIRLLVYELVARMNLQKEPSCPSPAYIFFLGRAGTCLASDSCHIYVDCRVQVLPPIQYSHSAPVPTYITSLHHQLENSPEAKFLVPDDSGIGLYWPAWLHRPACRYNRPLPESTYPPLPHSQIKNLAEV